VEQNVSKGEILVDNTVNVFTIAQVDRLAVWANLPESDLPLVQALGQSERQWTIHTVRARATEGIVGRIDEIGYIIDPNQHTAIIKGYIDNPNKEIRAGQFVRATIYLPPPRNVVEIPVSALVDDGKQSIVFIETDAKQNWYTMRRVVVTHRFDKTVYISSDELPAEEQRTTAEKEAGLLPRLPLLPKDRVLLSGALELKAAILEQEARQKQAPVKPAK
jgi:cobalt-zinc-cadmium efflux system membrane fusion protein